MNAQVKLKEAEEEVEERKQETGSVRISYTALEGKYANLIAESKASKEVSLNTF